MQELAELDDQAVELRLALEKCQVVMVDVYRCFEEMKEKGLLVCYGEENMMRSLIALDYICELQKILKKLQEQVESLENKATKVW